MSVEKPIFIVGCGRAGSTLLYNLVCGHKDLVWFSSFTTQLTGLPQLAILNPLYYTRQTRNVKRPWARLMPIPSEAYEVWDVIHPVANSPSDPPLTADAATEADLARATKLIEIHRRWQGGERFINKNTRNTRRIPYLNALFPDALFVHIVRNPLATVNSLINVDWWPDLEIWNAGSVTPNQWITQGKDPIELAAGLWIDETQLALDSEELLGERYMRVYYEDIINKTNDTLAAILEYCGLGWSDEFAAFVESFNIRSMNYKYRENLSQEQQQTIISIVGDVAENLDHSYLT